MTIKLKLWKFFSVWMVLMLIASLGAVVVPASPAAADGGSWRDNFNGGPQQTWVNVNMGTHSTFQFINNRYQLHTEYPLPSSSFDGVGVSYVDYTAADCIMQTKVQRIGSGDKFLAYLIARGDVVANQFYSLGISSGDGSTNQVHLWLGKYNGTTYTNLGGAGGSIFPWGTDDCNWYDCNIKFAVFGDTLKGKVWKVGESEPAGWQVTATDSSFTSGIGGVMLATYHTLVWDTVQVAFDDVSLTTLSEVESETIADSGTMTSTATGGDVHIYATGSHTITTAKYGGNPAGTPTFQATGNYYDVHLDSAEGVTKLEIQFSPATASTVIYYWTGSTWARCSNQTYAGGKVTVTVTGSTQPNLTDLFGLIFGSGTTPPPPPAPTPEPAVSGISTALPQSHGAGGLSVITPPQGPMPLPNMLVQSAAITTGKQVSAKVTNTGGASGSLRVTLYAGNNAVESKNVSLAPGDIATVSFDASSLGPGTYNIKVNNVPAGQLTVEGGSSPLFFISLAAFLVLMAILIIIYFRRRRAAGW